MATYAVGDIQGCFRTLERLLEQIRFSAQADRIWLAGDLVNRGPSSLEVLRWARDLGDRAVVVLGNHDLHLIGIALGGIEPRRRDTLDQVLGAPDRDELVGWLREQPLLHRDGPYLLLHAGLPPSWTLPQAVTLAREAESALRADDAGELLKEARAAADRPWRESMVGRDRVIATVAHLTRVRTLTADGTMCGRFSGPPEEAPPECIPWFRFPGRLSAGTTILFGHWAAAGFRREPGMVALDSGCVWGGSLTALRLDDGEVFQEPLADPV